MLDKTKVFHFGTLSLTDEPSRTATCRAVAYAMEKGKLISFDPNLRKPLWKDLNQAKEMMLWGLAQSDVVKISDEEVDFLWGISPEEGAEKILCKRQRKSEPGAHEFLSQSYAQISLQAPENLVSRRRRCPG